LAIALLVLGTVQSHRNGETPFFFDDWFLTNSTHPMIRHMTPVRISTIRIKAAHMRMENTANGM
jgi:hypothetical protein